MTRRVEGNWGESMRLTSFIMTLSLGLSLRHILRQRECGWRYGLGGGVATAIEKADLGLDNPTIILNCNACLSLEFINPLRKILQSCILSGRA